MHDANGEELKVGDEVYVPVIVVDLQAFTEYCNVTIETQLSMPPYINKDRYTLNTKQLIKDPNNKLYKANSRGPV